MLHRVNELQNSSTATNKVTEGTGVSEIPNLQVSVAHMLFVERSKLKQSNFV